MFLTMACLLTFASLTVNAKNHMMPEPTKEQREKMAGNHEKMAQCLRSEKTMKDCHDEMKKSCEEGGKEACPMMGKMGHGMMKHKKGDTSKETEEKK